MEQWKPIPGYEGLYEVSDLGRVRSFDRLVTRRNNGGAVSSQLHKGRMLAQTKDRKGYLYVTLQTQSGRKRWYVAQLVLHVFVGASNGLLALHSNGLQTDNKLSNLRYGTHKDNSADAQLHGTVAKGERQGGAKLTDAAVKDIRQSALSNAALAKQYGVGYRHIWRVRRGELWRHV